LCNPMTGQMPQAKNKDWVSDYETFASQSGWSPTVLSEKEEGKFKEWIKKTEWFSEIKSEIGKENNIPLNKMDDDRVFEMIAGRDARSDYDYRGAWKSGVATSGDQYDGGKQHWPDADQTGKMLKSPKHPTAWKEFFMRQYNVNPDELGLDTIAKARLWEKK
jgi:hypothetical protein